MPRAINLLDAERKKRSPYATLALMGGAVLVLILVMGIWGGRLRWQASAVIAENRALEAERASLQTQLDELQSGIGFEEASKTLKANLAVAQAQLATRQKIEQALKRGQLGATDGFSEELLAFARQIVPGLWLTRIEINAGGNAMRIIGRAQSSEAVATFLRRLRSEPVMRGRPIDVVRLVPVEAQPADADLASSAPAAGEPGVYEFEFSRNLAESTAEGGTAP